MAVDVDDRFGDDIQIEICSGASSSGCTPRVELLEGRAIVSDGDEDAVALPSQRYYLKDFSGFLTVRRLAVATEPPPPSSILVTIENNRSKRNGCPLGDEWAGLLNRGEGVASQRQAPGGSKSTIPSVTPPGTSRPSEPQLMALDDPLLRTTVCPDTEVPSGQTQESISQLECAAAEEEAIFDDSEHDENDAASEEGLDLHKNSSRSKPGAMDATGGLYSGIADARSCHTPSIDADIRKKGNMEKNLFAAMGVLRATRHLRASSTLEKNRFAGLGTMKADLGLLEGASSSPSSAALTGSVIAGQGTMSLSLGSVTPTDASMDGAGDALSISSKELGAVPTSTGSTSAGAAAVRPCPLPSPLHELCARPDATLPELRQALEVHPDAVSEVDMNGCLPLHVLGENEPLVSRLGGREVASAFALLLMKAYPGGIIARDRLGRMPFFAQIEDWLQWVYQTHKRMEESNSEPVAGTRLVEILSRKYFSDGEESADAAAGTVASDSFYHLSLRAFPAARLWEEVEWCLDMLSLAMEGLGGKGGGLHKVPRRRHIAEDKRARTELATHLVTAMPTLLKTVLLLEGDGGEVRKRLLRSPIFRRALLCPESVGPWLTLMLGRKETSSARAIDYLEMVSRVSAEDYVGRYRSVQSKDVEEYKSLRKQIFGAIERQTGIIVSLLMLPTHEQERAAATPAIRHVMRENLRRPFVIGLVLIDLVLHVVLLAAFRKNFHAGDTAPLKIPTKVVVAICIHYLFRKVSEAISIFNISPRVFWGYITNLWIILDFLTIAGLFVAFIWEQNHPDVYIPWFLTLVLGLLWIHTLTYLKVVNRPLSTFILTVFQILRDLRHFVILLLVIILMFGELFKVSLMTIDNGAFCTNDVELSAPAMDFCSPKIGNSYLRVYALLLGDFELDDYRETTIMTVLFVVSTVIGVIIMLNLLIAVMTDSYDKAKTRSVLIFGRARAAFVAQNQALERFLLPGESPLSGLQFHDNPWGVLVLVTRVVRWMVLVSLVGTLLFAEAYLFMSAIHMFRGRIHVLRLIFVLLFIVILTAALIVMILLASHFWIRECASPKVIRFLDCLERYTGIFTGIMASWLFGLDNGPDGLFPDSDDYDKEWTGRLYCLQNMFETNLERTKQDIRCEILALEQRLCEHR